MSRPAAIVFLLISSSLAGSGLSKQASILRKQQAASNPAAWGVNVCSVCGQSAKSACSKCRTARYCGREHQSQDWKAGGHNKVTHAKRTVAFTASHPSAREWQFPCAISQALCSHQKKRALYLVFFVVRFLTSRFSAGLTSASTSLLYFIEILNLRAHAIMLASARGMLPKQCQVSSQLPFTKLFSTDDFVVVSAGLQR